MAPLWTTPINIQTPSFRSTPNAPRKSYSPQKKLLWNVSKGSSKSRGDGVKVSSKPLETSELSVLSPNVRRAIFFILIFDPPTVFV